MKKTLMMLAALMTIALFAGCSDDDDDVLTPPDENTEQGENTDNQGEENEGDENDGDENDGDENDGDENDGDENDGDENDGDENDGDENDGDENDGDENDGDENDGDENDGSGDEGGDGEDEDEDDGDDDTTDGVVPSTKVTEWGESVWEDLGTNTYTGETVTTDDFTYSDGLLNFVNGNDGKGVKFGKTLSTYCAKLQGKGNATTDCFQFKVNTNGTLKVAVTSGNKDTERSVQVYVGGETYGEALSCPGYDGLTEPKEHTLEVTGISGETTIAIASANSGNNIFTLKWVPTGVTE